MGWLSQDARNRLLYVAPVALVAALGLAWIAVHASPGRGHAHTLFQVLALAESVAALLLRHRKPAGALAGILAAYLLFDLQPVLGPAVLLALLTLVMGGSRRTAVLGAAATTVTVVALPYLHGDHPTVAAGLAQAAVVGGTVAAGAWIRARGAKADGMSSPGPGSEQAAHPSSSGIRRGREPRRMADGDRRPAARPEP